MKRYLGFKSIKSKIAVYIAGIVILFSAVMCTVFLIFFMKYSIDTTADDLMHHTKSISENISGAQSVTDGISSGRGVSGKGKKNNRNHSGMSGGIKGYIRLANSLADAEVFIIDMKNEDVITGGETVYNTYSDMPKGYTDVIQKSFSGESGVVSDINKMSFRGHIISYAPVYGENDEIIGGVVLDRNMNFMESGIKNVFMIVIMSIVSAIILSVIAGIFLSGRMINSLSVIKNTISEIAKGNTGKKTGLKRNDEIGQLRKSVDTMSEKLKKADEERDKLEKLREEFISNISHELRTPVTVMRGMAEMLSDGIVSDENEKDEMIEKIKNESIYMQRLVNDTLELSRLQNAEFNIDSDIINIQELVSDASRSIRHLAAEKNINVITDISVGETYIKGDYARLRQLILVLGDNAVKFSEENTDVKIKVYTYNNKVRVSVKDRGCGIADSDIENIFERFSRSRDERNKRGTGLGLAIAQRIAKRHNTELKVKSEYQKGSTFYIDFDIYDNVM